MKQEIIGTDREISVKPNDAFRHSDSQFRTRRGQMAKHSEFLDWWRHRGGSQSKGRVVAVICQCNNGLRTVENNFTCPNCGKQGQ